VVRIQFFHMLLTPFPSLPCWYPSIVGKSFGARQN